MMPALLAAVFTLGGHETPMNSEPAPLWLPAGVADGEDVHAAFRGAFNAGGSCEIRMVGASNYIVWLDGKLIEDGPARYPKAFPEYQTVTVSVAGGKHVLAVHLHQDGVTTRVLAAGQPFLWCQVLADARETPVSWKCERLSGYRPKVRRISDILGWIDWVDTNQNPVDWQQPDFDDSRWLLPASVDPGIGQITAAKTRPVKMVPIPLHAAGEGKLTENFGYERDDPAVRFFLRDLEPKDVPAQGVWRRYDLGRVRLGRPKFTLELPAGAVVEFADCEQLRSGRVHPWITLSGSQSCNLDHFEARGGVQEFMPFTPKGGRFLEIHVLTPGPVKFLKEEFLERTYYGEPEGKFECDDPLLNKIWSTGVDTLRACAEDGIIDNPTRERGQWTGDVVSVATNICGVAYSDLSLSRRALVQAAQAARSDGLVAGVGPGDPGYLSTYAAQWVSACVRYWELSGDKSLLEGMYPAAAKNLSAFEAKMTPDGLRDDLGWAFVDWGYVRNEGPSDMALNMHYLMALGQMVRWCSAVGQPPTKYRKQSEDVAALVKRWLRSRLGQSRGWENVGYQRAALALLAGIVEPSDEKACIAFIEHHLLSCFPNDPNGPRLSDPSVANDRIMTPYFCHFAFDALLQHGEVDFVLGQFRKCWGWALGDGRTTWLEVFDTRWSHCHEWSGCPTWQLTRYVLGVRPRLDVGENLYQLDIHPGSLKRASGQVPLSEGGAFHVEWAASGSQVRIKVQTPKPIRLRIGGQIVLVEHIYEGSLKV